MSKKETTMFETMVLLALVCPGRVAWDKGSLSFTPWWIVAGEYTLAKVMAARNGTLNSGAETRITRPSPPPTDEEAIIERTPFPESNGR